MKKSIFLLLMTAGFCSSIFAQTQTPAPPAPLSGAKIEFVNPVHDFGNIKQGVPASADFVFKNTGTAPLILTNVQASCGCTVPTWPREPIAPGGTAKITATYNAASIGNFGKSITVTHNGASATDILTIKGVVMSPPVETPAPVVTPQ
jgi:hypothetical protein